MTSTARRRGLAGLLCAALAAGLLTVMPTVSADAANGSDFDPGFIISDEVFYNRSAMNPSQVQSFLNEKGQDCRAAGVPCLKDFSLGWAARGGDQYCGALPAGSGSAATYFTVVASACGINPQVLLVLVEKEQSLVTRRTPTEAAYRYATGFNCPDTSPCDSASSGFATQLYLAAKQFQRYRANPGGWNYQAGRENNILYNPNRACGQSAVFIRNQATAGLYNYTPYQPNAAALANLYSTGDSCSSYGNRNFWRMFTDWFGSPANFLRAASFEASVEGWGFANGALDRQIVGPASDAKAGRYYLAMYTATRGRSLSQDVVTQIAPRQSFTGSIWVRSATAGKSFSGSLAIWALGGSTEVASRKFTVGAEWTEITLTLPIARSGHSMVRLEVYLDSTDAMLNMDSTSLIRDVQSVPREPVAMSAPSFEASVANWEFKNGFMNRAIYQFGAEAHDGTWILASNTAVPGRSVGQDVPAAVLPGDSYTATVWLRSSSGTVPFTGSFALWSMGARPEAGSTNFSVGPAWTPVTTTLTTTQASSSLRFEIYLNSVDFDLWIDDASITPNLLGNPSFEASASGWDTGVTSGALERTPGGAVRPADGRAFATTTAAYSTGSLATDVKRAVNVGDTYTATIWLRAVAPGNTWKGTLALWGLGGTAEVATAAVEVPDTWTRVTVSLTAAQSAHDTLRLELYSSSPGEQLQLDGAQLR